MNTPEKVKPSSEFYASPKKWISRILNDEDFGLRMSDEPPAYYLKRTYRRMGDNEQKIMRDTTMLLLQELSDIPHHPKLTPEGSDNVLLLATDLFADRERERLEAIVYMKSFIADSRTKKIMTQVGTDITVTLHERAAQSLIGLKAMEQVPYWEHLAQNGDFYVHIAFRGMVLADFDKGFNWLTDRITTEAASTALIRSLPYLYEVYGERTGPYVEKALSQLHGADKKDLKLTWDRIHHPVA